jgi:hypothetical protein
MPPKLRGKWALGITPRNFTWVIKDKLAICERPGGYGENHRRVRRQEEIIWLRENHFDLIVSIIAAPHNLHAYEELNLQYRHRPLSGADDLNTFLKPFYRELHDLMNANKKIIMHAEEVGDRLLGIIGGYIRSTTRRRQSSSPSASAAASSTRGRGNSSSTSTNFAENLHVSRRGLR